MTTSIAIMLPPSNRCQNKVAAIRAFRTLTRASLRDAKDSIEMAQGGHKVVVDTDENVESSDIADAVESLKKEGFKVEIVSLPRASEGVIFPLLKECATLAISTGEYDLASDLAQLLKKYEA